MTSMRAFQRICRGGITQVARPQLQAPMCMSNCLIKPRREFSTVKPKVDMALLKTLREMTGAPVKDCKKAVLETADDTETDAVTAACNWLRLAGKSQMTKRAGMTASEGLVAVNVSEDSRTGVLVEINSETDFVAKNEKFQALLLDVIEVAATI